MATAIPVISSEILMDSSIDDVSVTGGAGGAQTLSAAHTWYMVSNKSAAVDGESLLQGIQSALAASSLDGWTVKLSAPTAGLNDGLRVQLSHDAGVSRTVNFDALLATNLGFTSASFAVAAFTTVTATYRPRWLWSPDQPVNRTGPRLFDPAVYFATPSSAGAAQRSSDMTANYVENGVQYEALYEFLGVEYNWKVFPDAAHVNEDLVGFWSNGFRKGRRCLWWRDRADAAGSAAPSGGASSPFKYIIYGPQPDLRAAALFKETVEYNSNYFDVSFPLWVTDLGESLL